MYQRDLYESNGSGWSFVKGLCYGTAAGVALGLLLAPRSGSETRHQIADSAGRARRRANEAWEGASERMSDLSRRVIRRGTEKVDEAARAAEDMLERGRQAAEAVAERARAQTGH